MHIAGTHQMLYTYMCQLLSPEMLSPFACVSGILYVESILNLFECLFRPAPDRQRSITVLWFDLNRDVLTAYMQMRIADYLVDPR